MTSPPAPLPMTSRPPPPPSMMSSWSPESVAAGAAGDVLDVAVNVVAPRQRRRRRVVQRHLHGARALAIAHGVVEAAAAKHAVGAAVGLGPLLELVALAQTDHRVHARTAFEDIAIVVAGEDVAERAAGDLFRRQAHVVDVAISRPSLSSLSRVTRIGPVEPP